MASAAPTWGRRAAPRRGRRRGWGESCERPGPAPGRDPGGHGHLVRQRTGSGHLAADARAPARAWPGERYTGRGPESRRGATPSRTGGVLGEPRVNVVQVNLALDRRAHERQPMNEPPGRQRDGGLHAAHAAQAGPAQDLPRLRAGRRQDLQHAGGGAPALLPRRGRRRRLRRDPRPPRDRGARRRTRAPPPQADRPTRARSFEELDTDAVIARHPTWVLVDELAHTNVPGARHQKRWQSVEEIRRRAST